MGYHFNTIDGLFRPNYKVYQPFLKKSESKSLNSENVKDYYDSEDINRVKSFMKELSLKKDDLFDTESYNEDILYSSEDYDNFKIELDKFIKKNPEYEPIKDALQNLAALESNYKMDATNNSGSTALGWFQFTDDTRKNYTDQSREEFANDPQTQLLIAAQYYTKLQEEIKRRNGDPNDFVTMYGAWWRPQSAYEYLSNANYNYITRYGESFQDVIQRARNLVNKNGKGNN